MDQTSRPSESRTRVVKLGAKSRLAWLIPSVGVLALLVAIGVSDWLARPQPAPDPGPTSVSESEYWSVSNDGRLTVDLSPLVDPNLSLPPESRADGFRFLIVDIDNLPGGWQIEHVIASGAPFWRSQGGTGVPYFQSLNLRRDDGLEAYLAVSGTAILESDRSGTDVELPGTGQPITVRGYQGETSALGVSWIETEQALVTARVFPADSEETAALVSGLSFETVNSIPAALPNSSGTRAWTPSAEILVSGPTGNGTTWTLDAAEVLVVKGQPRTTGRSPTQPVTVPEVQLAVDGLDLVVAGVAPEGVWAVRVLSSRSVKVADGERAISAELPVVRTPTSRANRLFGFSIPGGLDVVRFQLIDEQGEVLWEYEIPPISLPSFAFSTQLLPAEPAS